MSAKRPGVVSRLSNACGVDALTLFKRESKLTLESVSFPFFSLF